MTASINNTPKALPAASVVIPTYNAASYLADAVKSVLNQSLAELELIIVDDCSTDDSLSILSGIKDDRIKLLRNPVNKGASYSRNRGFDIAEGKWIAILDADDWFSPDRLEQLVAIGDRDNLDLIADNLFMVETDGDAEEAMERTWPLHFPSNQPVLDKYEYVSTVDFVRGNMPGEHNPRYGLIKPLFRRSFLELYRLRYPEDAVWSEDVGFYITCLSKGGRMRVTPEAYYYYRHHPNQISRAPCEEIFEHQAAQNTWLIENFHECHHQAVRAALQERHEAILREARYQETIRAVRTNSYLRAAASLLRRPSFLLQTRTLRSIYMQLFGKNQPV